MVAPAQRIRQGRRETVGPSFLRVPAGPLDRCKASETEPLAASMRVTTVEVDPPDAVLLAPPLRRGPLEAEPILR